MKIKDYLKKNKDIITNITKEDLKPNIVDWNMGEQDITYQNIAMGNGYIFYVYDLMSVLDKDELVIMTGHEETIVYNKTTKKYTTDYTR